MFQAHFGQCEMFPNDQTAPHTSLSVPIMFTVATIQNSYRTKRPLSCALPMAKQHPARVHRHPRSHAPKKGQKTIVQIRSSDMSHKVVDSIPIRSHSKQLMDMRYEWRMLDEHGVFYDMSTTGDVTKETGGRLQRKNYK
jgi:hypothetical protein